MAQNITLLGASYSDVPSVELPKTGGGTAQFDDTTIASNAASASDITSGKLAFVNGLLITGTASGGGGGGLEYESGTWTPASDVADYTILFSKTHSGPPFFYMIVDSGTDYFGTTNTNYATAVFSPYLFCGAIQKPSSGSGYYAYVHFRYRTSSSASFSSGNNVSTSSADLENWATSTGIRAYGNSTSRYWRSGRTYKWVAVWKPTS